MTPQRRDRLKGWVTTLTPIIIALLAMRTSNKANDNSEIAATSVAQVVQDRSEEADSTAIYRAWVVQLRKDVKKLKLARSGERAGSGGQRVATPAEPPPGVPSPLAKAGKIVTAPFRWAWNFLKGG